MFLLCKDYVLIFWILESDESIASLPSPRFQVYWAFLVWFLDLQTEKAFRFTSRILILLSSRYLLVASTYQSFEGIIDSVQKVFKVNTKLNFKL